MVLYSENHIWFDRENNTLGLSEFAVRALGGVEHFELCGNGDLLRADEPFGSLESAKMVMELISPVSGRVVAVNRYPDGADWLLAIELVAPVGKMMDKEEYDAFVAKHFA